MAESELKQKTAKGLFWGGFSNGIQQIISLGFGIYFARVLTAEDYGIPGVLSIFTAISAIIINGGFSVALINKQDATHKDYNAVFWFTFFVGLLLYIVLFFSAPLITWFFRESVQEPILTNLSRVVFISFFMGGIGTVSSTIMLKQSMTKQLAIIDIVSLLTAVLVGFTMVMNGQTYWAIVAQTVLHTSLSPLLKFIFAPWKPTWRFDFSPLKQLVPFSIKIFFTNIIIQINGNIFSFILGKFYTAADLGQYDRGQKWVGMGQSFLGGMINYVAQPILSQVNEDKNRQIIVLRKLIRFGAFVSFPLLLGLAFVGKEFIVVAIGEKWLPSVPIMQLFCIWGSIGFLSTLFTNLIFTQGKSGIYMNVTIGVCLLQMAVILCLLRMGIIPMLIGCISVNFVGLFVWYYYVWKLIGLRLQDFLKDTLPYLGITLLCFGVVWLITQNVQDICLLLVLKITISGIFYIFALKISNSVMFKESVEFLMNQIKK